MEHYMVWTKKVTVRGECQAASGPHVGFRTMPDQTCPAWGLWDVARAAWPGRPWLDRLPDGWNSFHSEEMPPDKIIRLKPLPPLRRKKRKKKGAKKSVRKGAARGTKSAGRGTKKKAAGGGPGVRASDQA